MNHVFLWVHQRQWGDAIDGSEQQLSDEGKVSIEEVDSVHDVGDRATSVLG